MASSIIFDLDMRDFGREVQLLANATKRTVAEVVRDQARLTVRDLIRSTPPHGTRPIMEDWTFQRHKGERTIETDVNRLFSRADKIKAIMFPTSLSHNARNIRRWYFKQLAEQGRWDRLTEALFGMHVTTYRVPIIGQLSKSDYRQKWVKWQKRGRISQKVHDNTMVWDGQSIKGVIKQIQMMVGYAKAGWLKAAEALGLQRIPSWVSRHSGAPGMFIDQTTDTNEPSFTMGNDVSYIAYLNAGNRLLNRALNNRQRAMEIQTEQAIDYFVERFNRAA